jgi:uncharacterized protein YndB with AHSA1/START domain
LHSDINAVARTPESTIRLEQRIGAPAEHVFAAWIDPDRMTSWDAPTDDFKPTQAEVNLQVGGRYRVASCRRVKIKLPSSPASIAASIRFDP